jgi:PEGA domain
MMRNAWLGVAVFVAAASMGCVERRYVVTSDPPGALVFRNGVPLGPAPVDDFFVYYGNYDITLVKDGYETLHAKVKINAPWYEYPPLDFISENLFPYTIRDIREDSQFQFTLQPLQAVRPDDVRRRAAELRNQGQRLGAPAEGEVPPPVPLTPPGPVAPNAGTVVMPPSNPSPQVLPGTNGR